MHALIVVSHPDPASLTHAVARRIAEGAQAAGHTCEMADLHAEGFDPRFHALDLAVHRRTSPPPQDVVAEQARVDRADALVLAYPVYWWSMPGLMKGWIDRVFSNGWAYDETPGGALVKKLGHLPIHLVGIGGASPRTYERRGYARAMKAQIDQGIFDFCGAPVVTSELLLDADSGHAPRHLERAHEIGRRLFEAATRGEGAPRAAGVPAIP
ncbi:MAG TPA: NAD(P)H-dependent oxidoreductase [Burkholderiaceae bacterium]|nr:NAD(P)H-dependent oxidoreductase [Burkholderiaceae bacterium]